MSKTRQKTEDTNKKACCFKYVYLYITYFVIYTNIYIYKYNVYIDESIGFREV